MAALIDADKAGVNVDERGFINVTNELRTNVSQHLRYWRCGWSTYACS